MQQIEIGAFASFNIAIMVLAVGKLLHRRLHFLRSYNIPEPVTSGLLVSLLVGVLHAVSGLELGFNLAVRDFLLLYFFAGIGLNADVRTLRSGGWPLLILLAATVVYIVLQNLAGVTMASLLGLNPLVGLLTGSVSLVGGTARQSPGGLASPSCTACGARWRSVRPAPRSASSSRR